MSETHLEHRASGYQSDAIERASGDRWITMSNALAIAGHRLSLSEKRLVTIAISKLDSRRSGAIPMIRISASEYSEVAGVEMSAAYGSLQTAAKNLFDRKIAFFEEAYYRGKKKDPTLKKTEMRWVDRADYSQREGWVALSFTSSLVIHLLGLRSCFTSYQLKQTHALRSVYSWRLLELLTRFQSTGVAEYTVEDFRASMDVPENVADFGQVKRRYVVPAIKELQEKDGWKIELELIKGGKRVKALRFKFERDPQGRFEGFDEPSALQEEIADEGLDSAHSVEPPEPPALPPPVHAPASEVQPTSMADSMAQWKIIFPQGFIKMNQLAWRTAAPLPDGGETPDGKKS